MTELPDPSDAQKELLARFAREHRNLACFWVREILSDAEEVDDAVQEAFMLAARGLYRFDVTLPFEPWIKMVVKNAARRVKEASGRRTRALVPLEDENVQECAPDVAVQVLDDIEMAGRLREITDALDRLLPQQRWLIAVEYGDEMPRSLIAAKLKVGKTALNCRLYRARKAVRENLVEHSI